MNIAAVLPDNGCATLGDGRQWCTTDVGAVGNAGSSANYQTTGSATTFTLATSGWGAGIAQVGTDAQDSVRYVYTQPIPADGAPNVEIVARLVSADDNMQAGLMIRESNDPNARMAALWLAPKVNDSCYRGGQGVLGSINFSDRAYMNGTPATAYLTSNHASTRDEAPLWMKIQRKGNDFAAFISRDGTHWTGAGGGQIATATTELGLYAGGLWNVGNTPKTAVFDNVRIGPIQQTYTTTWIGASAVADSTDFVSVTMQGLYVAPNGNSYKYASDAESGHNLVKVDSAGQIVPIWPFWNGFVGVQQGGIAADASHMFLGIRSNTNPESYYVQGRVLSSDPVSELSIYKPGSDPNGYATFDATMPLGRIGGMATGNGNLYVSDFDNNVVRTINTTTMVEDTSHRFAFSRPGLLAVDHAGNLWIANQPDYPDGPDLFWSRALDPCQSNCVSSVIECHHPDGSACLSGTTPIKITGINNPTALAIDPNPLVSTSAPDRLLVADNGPDQNIKICTQLGAAAPSCSATFGVTGGIYEASGPGLYEVAGSSPRFYAVRGIGTDQNGDLYVASSAPHTEIRKFAKNTSGSWNTTNAWSKPVDGLGLEPGAFDPLSDGNDYFTLTQHFTFDTSKTAAGTEWGRKGMTWNPFTTNKDTHRFNRATQSPLIRKIGTERFMFVYLVDQPNYITYEIYRFVGEIAVPAGAIRGHWVNSGTFARETWIDTNGDGVEQSTEVFPANSSGLFALDIDSSGDAWVSDLGPNAQNLWTVWHAPVTLLGTPQGNVPVYHLDTASSRGVALAGLDSVGVIRYDATHDAMYAYGGKAETSLEQVCTKYCWVAGASCPSDPNAPDPPGCSCHPERQTCPCGTPHPVVTRYDGWVHGAATPRYSVELPDPRRTDTQPDDFGWRLTDPACGCSDWGYRSFEIAGDLFFAGELAGPVHVHEGTTGVEVNRLFAGPEESSSEYWPDYAVGGLMQVYQRQATGEYLIAVDDDSNNRDRTLVFRMPPPPPSTWTPGRVTPAAWYVANNVDQTAGAVTTWFDQSGNDRHLVAYTNPAGRPTYQPSGWGGKPTVTFSGNQLLHSDHWSVAPTGSASAFTVMAVVQSAAPQNAGVVSWWNDQGTGSVWADLKASGTRTLADLTRLDANNGGQQYTTAQDLGTLPHVIVWRFSPDVAKLTIDGVTTSSPPQNPLVPIGTDNTLVVGALSFLPSGQFQGNISELVIVPGSLSDADVASFQTYARQNWPGLPVGGVAVNTCLDATGHALPNTTVCDDGNPATVADRCNAGTCAGHAAPAGSPGGLSPLVWYSAEDLDTTGVPATGAKLPQWSDRSGHNRPLTEVFNPGQPTFYPARWNSTKPTVTFNGGNLYRLSSWTSPPAGNDTSFSVVAVLRTTAAKTQGVATWLNSVGTDDVACRLKLVGSATVGDLTRVDGSGATQEVSTATDLASNGHVIAWRFSPETLQVTVDGVVTSSMSLPSLGPITPDTFQLGAGSFFGSDFFTGDLSEIAVIPSYMTDTQVAAFRTYAQGMWTGLP